MTAQVVEARAGDARDRRRVEQRFDLLHPADERVDPTVVLDEIGLGEHDQRYGSGIPDLGPGAEYAARLEWPVCTEHHCHDIDVGGQQLFVTPGIAAA